MKQALRGRVRAVAGAGLLAGISACATLQQFAALRQVDFSIAEVGSGELAGIDLERLATTSDLRPLDGARLAAALADGELPLAFTIDVEAVNPADNNVTARMTRFAWTLVLDDRETVEGVVDRAIELPAGQPQVVPVMVRLDLLEFFEGNAADLLDLALRAAGAERETATVKLRAEPTVETPLGPISYPATITIVGD